MYTTRGLFEKDKLIFTVQVTFQVSDHFTVLSKRCTCIHIHPVYAMYMYMYIAYTLTYAQCIHRI